MSLTEGERMDPVTLIVTALAAGASAGVIDALKDNAKDAARAAYARLRGLVRKRAAGNPGAELALTEHEADPENWAAPLGAKLAQAGAGDDAELVAAAQALMDIIDQAGAKSGKYNVTIKDSKGIQVGDGNFQVNKF
jgi:RIP homotypic interaction motif